MEEPEVERVDPGDDFPQDDGDDSDRPGDDEEERPAGEETLEENQEVGDPPEAGHGASYCQRPPRQSWVWNPPRCLALR